MYQKGYVEIMHVQHENSDILYVLGHTVVKRISIPCTRESSRIRNLQLMSVSRLHKKAHHNLIFALGNRYSQLKEIRLLWILKLRLGVLPWHVSLWKIDFSNNYLIGVTEILHLDDCNKTRSICSASGPTSTFVSYG